MWRNSEKISRTCHAHLLRHKHKQKLDKYVQCWKSPLHNILELGNNFKYSEKHIYVFSILMSAMLEFPFSHPWRLLKDVTNVTTGRKVVPPFYEWKRKKMSWLSRPVTRLWHVKCAEKNGKTCLALQRLFTFRSSVFEIPLVFLKIPTL